MEGIPDFLFQCEFQVSCCCIAVILTFYFIGLLVWSTRLLFLLFRFLLAYK